MYKKIKTYWLKSKIVEEPVFQLSLLTPKRWIFYFPGFLNLLKPVYHLDKQKITLYNSLMLHKFSFRLMLWHKRSSFIFQDAHFNVKYLRVFPRQCGSEKTRSVTSNMSHVAQLCLPYRRYSKTRVANKCGWNLVYGMRVCALVYTISNFTHPF